MSALTGLHGPLALVLLAALLYAEETGIPLPLVPGDVLLMVGGVLAANHAVTLWALLPCAFVAVLGGALTALTWSRRLGRGRLQSLAARVGATRTLASATRRLQAAGARAIIVGRLMPGTRVYTSMAAGVVDMDLRAFLAGAIPAMVVWISGMTLVGYLVGVPAEHYFGRVERLALNAGILVAVAVCTYIAFRHLPARAAGWTEAAPVHRAPWRVAAALLVDGVIVVAAVSGIDELARDALGIGDPDELADILVVVVGTLVLYVGLARWRAGGTAGERLLEVSLRARPPAGEV